jgi:hypothetical protein
MTIGFDKVQIDMDDKKNIKINFYKVNDIVVSVTLTEKETKKFSEEVEKYFIKLNTI